MPFFKVVEDIALGIRYSDSLRPIRLKLSFLRKSRKTGNFRLLNPEKDSKFYSISKYTGMTEFMAPGKMKIINSKSTCKVKVPIYPKDEDAMNRLNSGIRNRHNFSVNHSDIEDINFFVQFAGNSILKFLLIFLKLRGRHPYACFFIPKITQCRCLVTLVVLVYKIKGPYLTSA